MQDFGRSAGAADGRRWLAALPAELEGQRDLLARLLDFCLATPLTSSLSVGCSLGRGAADTLSDVDAALGVDAARGEPGADRVMRVEDAVVAACGERGPLVGVLREQVGPPERVIRRVFAQFRDGIQLDLAIMAETEVRRGRAAPDFVSLYRSDRPGQVNNAAGSPTVAQFPPADIVGTGQIYEWAFLGWCALADMRKYLHRGSLWEALQRLHQARDRVWALWAAAHDALYPWHGLSQVLDQDPPILPPGIEATVARLDHEDLHRAARAMATVLAQVSEVAARKHDAALPRGMADYVIATLQPPIE
ncbi:hypothetical protein [Leekyejoonella antrihumi]|uniref:Nucleotidyltransferase domain-containing protein n=1 Tax=Leekyejoonella antrihumi TaxID=1660198 RepID=A0A563E304_9MICO|nr:hypothetical protein [Leekyejoonella antrihumi]TWP36785.1 hypothetical protein FGL98_08470 [Leekyejoonella antrihumi]